MFHYLYYSVTINESKDKFSFFGGCCYVAVKKRVAVLSSNFSVKLSCRGMVVFAFLDKSIPISL